MKRRYFIHVVAASLLFRVATKPRVAGLVAFSQKPDFAFFDERFHQARRIAASWSASNRLIGVQGDITPLWRNGLDRMTRDHPLHLRGVTTESFLFCLRILLGEHADVAVQVSRLDRNLLLWTMRTTAKPEYGTTP